MSENRVYLDHNATTPLADSVRQKAVLWLDAWGNPSSIHLAGRGPKQILRETRQAWAHLLGCTPLELIFTSGASESNSTVLKAVWSQVGSKRKHFIVSAVEHPSLQKTADWLITQGARVDRAPISRAGAIDMQWLEQHITEDTALVSIMAANNETGNIFPTREIARLAHAKGALMHADGVQMLGKHEINLRELDVDYASFSAHKFYALKGTGLLYVAKGRPYESLIWGGGQERHRRGGTENIFGIAAFGEVANLMKDLAVKTKAVTELRDYFEARVLKEIEHARLTGAEAPRLGNTSSLVIDGVDGETMLMGLDLKGFAVSTGAACSSGNPEPSPVLLAMGLTRDEAQNSLRVSLGWGNDRAQIDAFVEALKDVVARLRAIEAQKKTRSTEAV